MEYRTLKSKLERYLKNNGYKLIKNPARWIKKLESHYLLVQLYKSYYSNIARFMFDVDFDFLTKSEECTYGSVSVVFTQFKNKIRDYDLVFNNTSSIISEEIILDNLDDSNYHIIELLISMFEERYANIYNVIKDISDSSCGDYNYWDKVSVNNEVAKKIIDNIKLDNYKLKND